MRIPRPDAFAARQNHTKWAPMRGSVAMKSGTGGSSPSSTSSTGHMRASSRFDPSKRAVSTHQVRASSDCKLRLWDGRLPSSKRAVSILQPWCILNRCTSIVDLHRANFWDHGGQHGQESEEGKGKEDSQEEKEVAVQRNLLLSG
jgi:hypothetical protein